jgi:hypothetical protein
MLKKLMITPYFGKFPEWMDKFVAPEGYDWLLDTDLKKFKRRVRHKLGIKYPAGIGSPKVWDYRCALGLLYEDEIKGYDYWGHMDFDVAWGDVENYLPDRVLSEFDVYSSDNRYVCGCFSVYRNIPRVNNLFKEFFEWREKMIHPQPNGWVEKEYSRTLEASGLKYAYTFNQGNPWDRQPVLKKEGRRLFQKIDEEWKEIMMFHFRHSKKWPL